VGLKIYPVKYLFISGEFKYIPLEVKPFEEVVDLGGIREKQFPMNISFWKILGPEPRIMDLTFRFKQLIEKISFRSIQPYPPKQEE